MSYLHWTHYTQIKKTQIIIDSGNDYLICLKANLKKQYECIVENCKLWKDQQGYTRKEERNRGRIEKRQTFVYPVPELIKAIYAGIKTIIKQVNKRINKRTKKVEVHTRYFICSRQLSAKEAMDMIRAHWLIENRVHWVKDVVLQEDSSRIRNKNTSAIFSIFRSIILNLVTLHGNREVTTSMYMMSKSIENMRLMLV